MQFPDVYLGLATAVTNVLRTEVPADVLFFIVADNMVRRRVWPRQADRHQEGDYSIDFGAAQHVKGDAMVVFGPTSGVRCAGTRDVPLIPAGRTGCPCSSHRATRPWTWRPCLPQWRRWTGRQRCFAWVLAVLPVVL